MNDDLPLEDERTDSASRLVPDYTDSEMRTLGERLAELYESVFQEVLRVLKPSGFLYVLEPVAAGDLNDIMRLFHDEAAVRSAAQAAIVAEKSIACSSAPLTLAAVSPSAWARAPMTSALPSSTASARSRKGA